LPILLANELPPGLPFLPNPDRQIDEWRPLPALRIGER
jgi:hypothetical protein